MKYPPLSPDNHRILSSTEYRAYEQVDGLVEEQGQVEGLVEEQGHVQVQVEGHGGNEMTRVYTHS